MTLLHLGPLHPFEQALILVLAFGPFVLLALTIWVCRRRGSDDEDRCFQSAHEPIKRTTPP